MKSRFLFLWCALSVAPAAALAAEVITSPPADPNGPRFEVERDWSGELRPRYKGPQPEEALSTPVITPEAPRVARKSDPPPKIEVWDEADAQPRGGEQRSRERQSAARERHAEAWDRPERDDDGRRERARDERDWREREWAARERAEQEWEERAERRWRERERAERAWREEARMEREVARRERYVRRARGAERFGCDDGPYWEEYDGPSDRC
jgi:hypothetical protein